MQNSLFNASLKSHQYQSRGSNFEDAAYQSLSYESNFALSKKFNPGSLPLPEIQFETVLLENGTTYTGSWKNGRKDGFGVQ